MAARIEHRRGQDWLGPELGLPAADGEPDPAPPPDAAAVGVRPDDGRGDPSLEDHRGPLRTRTARRAGPHGCQEDRPDPRRWRLASSRPRDGLVRTRGNADRSDTTSSTRWSTITAASRTRRSSPTSAVRPAPRSSPVRLEQFHQAGIPHIDAVMTDNHWSYTRSKRVRHHPRGTPDRAHPHPTALPVAERQGRTVQPHPAERMGLPAGLRQQRRTRHRACSLARRLQHSTPPQRPRRPPPDQPTVTNLMAGYN